VERYEIAFGIILQMFLKTTFYGKNRISIGVLILILAFGISSCASILSPGTPTPIVPTATPIPPSPTPPPSAAIVNGEYITLVEFQAELARFKTAQTELGKTVNDEEANKIVLEDMIAQVLLAQGARAENFTLTEADLQSRIDALANQLGGAGQLSAWQSAHGYDDASFRIALKRSAEAAWMRDQIIAKVPASVEQVHIKQILTYTEADAQYVLNQLNGGADFDEMAALYDPFTRGELGWVPQGYLLDKPLDDAVFALQAGSYTTVIATDAGFHVVKVLERAEHPLSPDALLSMQENALKQWIDEQRAKAQIILAP
jgi:parvulin-like peptidyl-prolyl isomerase